MYTIFQNDLKKEFPVPSDLTAYDQLYSRIASGDIRPGDRLLETELAATLGVSRTPVREAIRRLESDGIVVHAPRVGAVVRSISQTEVVELYEMRMVLECTAAGMAAKHTSEAELRSLINLNDQMASAVGDSVKVAQLNRAFHRCILNASRNRYLVQCSESLSHTLILLGKTTLETEARIDLVTKQHTEIIDALKARQPDAAETAMARHMEASLDHRLRGLQQDG